MTILKSQTSAPKTFLIKYGRGEKKKKEWRKSLFRKRK